MSSCEICGSSTTNTVCSDCCETIDNYSEDCKMVIANILGIAELEAQLAEANKEIGKQFDAAFNAGKERDKYRKLANKNGRFICKQRNDIATLTQERDTAQATAFEDAAQVVRYYLKHQNYTMDTNEYETAVTVTCENLTELLIAKAKEQS